MFKKFILLSFLLLLSTVLKAQETIPFRLTKHNNIIVKTLVNQKDSLHLMFQIAMEECSVSPERTRKTDHIVFKNEISDGNTVKIGTKEYKNIRFFDNEFTGHESDGKIGTGIFKDQYFKIDYDNSQFVVYNQKPDLKDYEEIDLLFENGQFFVGADNIIKDKQQEAYFLLQSGYSGGLLYSDQFAEDHHLNENLKIIGEKKVTNSSGKVLYTKQGILPFFKIGNFVLKDVTAAFFTGEIKNQKTNYIAADVMRRFNWIFDADRRKVYIRKACILMLLTIK
ncbi:hypothetical protein VUJ46_00635 [Chryseobacterium sp. MYb264]|uniref:hypothetical protein n=1 Tax=Chryseobacterium sp. MYb264 TaxID=2745153 RepID=UPI002E14C389|nr:hypothetical protein VUJ46_00635 [Chryseobacterium sp. MYb264]